MQNNMVEGYIFFSNKVYEDIDSNGTPIKELKGSDSEFLGGSKKIFIWSHLLIEPYIRTNFEDGVYKKTDTLGYVLYDLRKQKYIRFETLSSNANELKRGSLSDPEGSFTNAIEYDPMNGVKDSNWKVDDTAINGKEVKLVKFIALDSLDINFAPRAKFWIDPGITKFPLQISYLLSKKNKDEFVYQMQLPFPEGKAVMITSFDYQPAQLPDSLTNIFKKWAERMDEGK